MSSVDLKDANDVIFRPDTFTRDEGGNTVHMQAMVPVDSVTGSPLDLATQATLAALKTVVDSLLTSAQAIEAAAEAINGKTTAVNTGAIAGTVALDAPTLEALETINASTGGLTNSELRASAVPVAVQSTAPVQINGIDPTFNGGILPVEILGGEVQVGDAGLHGSIGAGVDAAAGTDTGNFSLIALFKRLLGKIPSLGQATMAASQPVVIASNQTAVPVTGSFSASFTPDDTAALMSAIRALVHPIWMDVGTARLRVTLDAAQALGTVSAVTTVTTCATLTNAAQMGGVPLNSFVYDQMHLAWSNTVRRAVA